MKTGNIIISILVALWLCSASKNKDLTWVAIGDSITYLNDHTNETGNRVTKGYLTGVTEHFSNLQYVNKGYNGWTSGMIAQQFDSLSIPTADIYTIFLGTNDWWQGRPIGNMNDYKNGVGNETLYASYRIIIQKIHSLNPHAEIILITPMQRADFVYVNDAKNNAYGSYKSKNRQYLEQFAGAIDSIGRFEHIKVIDLYHSRFLPERELVNFKRLKDPKSGSYNNFQYPLAANIPFNPATDNYPYPKEAINLTFDGLHPSDKGNAIIANAVTNMFRRTMPELRYRANIATVKDSTWKSYISLREYNRPFWKTDTIIDETVQVIKVNDTASAALLFRAAKILAVKTADHSELFRAGTDYDYKNGKLTFGARSSVPYFNEGDLILDRPKPGYTLDGKVPGSYVLFSEGPYFASMQISVTYIKARQQTWHGPVPAYATATLPRALSKLRHNQKLKIVFYGNSIEAGYSASGLEKAPPYMPVWPELVIDNLKQAYGTNISFTNSSFAGRLAQWGKDSVSKRVITALPNLVIIGFGMNDGTQKIPGDVYRMQIKAIIDSVSAANKKTEFILIAPMLANPLSSFSGLQSSYKQELDKLKRTGVVIADITGVHEELLKHKTYQDMTGNNINHPNDYLARWYAQFITGLLIK